VGVQRAREPHEGLQARAGGPGQPGVEVFGCQRWVVEVVEQSDRD
jgi:hypothetical protein